jgi:ESF2/ABP1 family protein
MTHDNDGISDVDDLDKNDVEHQIHDTSFPKILSEVNLKRFQTEQDRTGVIYLSRIPPFMRPNKLRSLLSTYGEVGRIYLKPEGKMHRVSMVR